MEGVERARDRVQERLEQLTEGGRSPTVNQETVVADADRYERAIARSLDGVFRVKVAVTNDDDEVLMTPTEDGWALPGGTTDPGEPLGKAARRIARSSIGVDCIPREAIEATISGVRNGDDPDAEAVYRLAVVYAADAPTECTSPEGTDWRPTAATGTSL